MDETTVVNALRKCGTDMVASLPCDRNKGLTDRLQRNFHTIGLTREEDGVGICAGAHLAGGRPVMSIQSSGLGNMMNAVMSLTSVYGMPLPILASWRGMDNEPIEAQRPFNSRLPKMLEAYDIHYDIIETGDGLSRIKDVVMKAYSENRITVALIKPECWSGTAPEQEFGERARTIDLAHHRTIPGPSMSRLDAIRVVMDHVYDDTAVVSNIGVPSKEVYASNDRHLNFYMLGSYTQATPIGLGLAVKTTRDITVIDGDGSLLGSSVLPVVASEDCKNLTIVCLDNGTFGSTGNQMTNAYRQVDMELVARAYGIEQTMKVWDAKGLRNAVRKENTGTKFIHVIIRPGNSSSGNIPFSAVEIKRRFADALKNKI
jgi:sulfopyruvate decarboxylase subunit beta